MVRDPDRARAVYRTQPMLTGLSLRDAQPPVKERLEIVQGDALDRDSLQRALVGCAGVIYAATSSGWTQLSAFWRTMRTTRPEDVDFQVGGKGLLGQGSGPRAKSIWALVLCPLGSSLSAGSCRWSKPAAGAGLGLINSACQC